MKNTKLEITDRQFVFYLKTNDKLIGNTFITNYEIKFHKEKLNTFWKRLRWLITGKLPRR